MYKISKAENGANCDIKMRLFLCKEVLGSRLNDAADTRSLNQPCDVKNYNHAIQIYKYNSESPKNVHSKYFPELICVMATAQTVTLSDRSRAYHRLPRSFSRVVGQDISDE